MPAKDFYHNAVKNALAKAGWTVTHDPYTISFGLRDVFVDFGAERLLAAERGTEKIALEVKSFRSASDIHDVEGAVGQYAFYRSLLLRIEPERKLYLAVPQAVFVSTFEEPIVRPVVEDMNSAIVTFDPEEEEIVTWTN